MWIQILIKYTDQNRTNIFLIGLTQCLWSCLQSKSDGIDSFNSNSSLFLCGCLSLCVSLSVWQSSDTHRWVKCCDSPLNGAQIYFIPAESSPLSPDWLRAVKQVSDRTGVGLLTLSGLERNFLTCVWVCAAKKGALCKTIKGRNVLHLIIALDKRVRLGIPEVWMV